MVFNGTNEFSMDATALSISVSAMANKKAGIKEPNIPVSAIHFHCFISISFTLLNPAINKNTAVIIVLNAPN